MKAIRVKRDTLDDLRGRGLQLFANDLASRGCVEVLVLSSGLAASQAYVTARGRIVYVAGSRALVDRYVREVTPCHT